MDNGYKKLKRSRNDKMLCGVCGGIGEYLDIGPTIVRILWVILSLGSLGMGILIYFLAAVIVPDED